MGELAGIGLLALAAGACTLGVVVLVVVVVMIRSAVQRATDTVKGLGDELVRQAPGAVLSVGETELARGWGAFKRTINHEMLIASPEKLNDAVVKLAQTHGGELTCADVMAELSVTEPVARDTFQRLVGHEVCVHEERDTGDVWIFPAFKKKREVKVCDHCESIFEPDEAANECLNCGAQLKSATTI